MVLQSIEPNIVPRTIQGKAFSDIYSLFLLLYAIIDLVPRTAQTHLEN